MHVSLGELPVNCGGILSLTPADIGTERMFYDITKAEEDGHFGPDPVIWIAQELHVALELIASALDLEGEAWQNYTHHQTVWSGDGETRNKPSKMQREGLEVLRVMKNNPSELVAHYRKLPHFVGRELLEDKGGGEREGRRELQSRGAKKNASLEAT